MTVSPITVLLIEDNPGDALLIRRFLASAADREAPAFQLEVADRLSGGLARLSRGGVQVVLLDLSLPDSQGLETCIRAQDHAPDVPVVVLTGLDDERLALQAVQAGAQDYLIKGQIDSELLARAVRYAIERARLLAAMRSQSLMDALTGLYNRSAFFALTERQVRIANRAGRAFIMVFADVDRLKQINDTAGHAAGDHALQQVAALLRATFRGSDILARLGGDEFAVLAVDAGEDIERLKARLLRNLATRDASGDLGYTLSLSVGAAYYTPGSPFSIEALLARADEDMYLHKQGDEAR